MKKLLFAAVLAFSTIATVNDVQAQVRVNVNIGTPVRQSPWYASDDNYYYLPEQGVYYNVNRRMYVFQNNNQWVYAPNLPSRYRGFNWKNSHYVQVRDRSPFDYHNAYASRYDRNYRGGHVVYKRDQPKWGNRVDRDRDRDRRDSRGRGGWDRR